ncbi:hypothetical protein [Nostoc sp. FACHB-280]|uniref:hypothetical protein n=1 Tax=Nostoc sp. FACHB-280 TaxID=2692839 RepID=UPI00168A5D37|nr:hypothetical protein [Nostoc sp. FACHB-280]MBD2493952.1 hypothetical protein [Nostoc sp. FACHB-280]
MKYISQNSAGLQGAVFMGITVGDRRYPLSLFSRQGYVILLFSHKNYFPINLVYLIISH